MKFANMLAGAMVFAMTFELEAQSMGVAPTTGTGQSPDYVIREIPVSTVHHGQTEAPRFRLWESTSANWSGFAVPMEGTASDTFQEVVGSWIVPSVTGGRSAGYSSTWVGLDGYESDSVEQIGTEQDWTGRTQSNYAWFEMYPSAAYELNPRQFPVKPGDVISATVAYAGTTNVTVRTGRTQKTETEYVFKLTISSSEGWSYVVPSSYTIVSAAARSSAEWVVEAPSSYKVLPLADFGTAAFSGCEAASLGSGGALAPINFWTPDPLQMVDPEGGSTDVPALFGGGEAFTVSWE